MCRTSQPPRHDIYAILTELGTRKVPTFLPKSERIGTGNNADRIQIYNGDYAPSGNRIGAFENNWTVIGPDVFAMLPTHAEAIAYVAGLPADPAPQTQEQVTAGWAPKYDHESAWQEKQELTR